MVWTRLVFGGLALLLASHPANLPAQALGQDPDDGLPAAPALRAQGPVWPGRDARAFWPTGKALTDQEVDDVLRRFVRLVAWQLRSQAPDPQDITMEDLLGELTRRWVSDTPYASNAGFVQGARRAPGAIAQGFTSKENDYRLIVRRGWGICGDHQQLLLKLVDLALADPALVHLADQRIRVQDLSVVGEGVVELEWLTPNHAGVGLISNAAWADPAKVRWMDLRRPGQPPQRTLNTLGLAPGDVLVYDLWVRPPLAGGQTAEAWGREYVDGHWKQNAQLARDVALLQFGILANWRLDL